MACDSAVQCSAGTKPAGGREQNKGNPSDAGGRVGRANAGPLARERNGNNRALPFGDQTSSLDIRYLTRQKDHLVMSITM